MEQTNLDMSAVIRDAIEQFARAERSKAEPAYKTELTEERKRREQLEQRVNELVEENGRSRARAEEVERGSSIRTELQKLGVAKLDLAYRAVKDDVYRAEDGRLLARTDSGELPLRDYLTHFVTDNPELMPARMAGGSGAVPPAKPAANAGLSIDLDKIRPGMNPEELDKVRQEISRVAAQTMRGV
jgi:hypothetical protein